VISSTVETHVEVVRCPDISADVVVAAKPERAVVRSDSGSTERTA
jgi:hypothetical protein